MWCLVREQVHALSPPDMRWPMAACPSPIRPLCLFLLYRTGNRMRGSVTGMGTCSPIRSGSSIHCTPGWGPTWLWIGEWGSSLVDGNKQNREALEPITDVTNDRRHLVHRQSLKITKYLEMFLWGKDHTLREKFCFSSLLQG